MNKIKKIIYVIERKIIKIVDCFSSRIYMKLYISYLRKIGINIDGTPRYIHPSVMFDGEGYKKTYIGDNVVISKGVLLLNHDYSITCGLRTIGRKINHEAYWLKNIEIKNNVFIGANSIILPGTVIENNCIIGAGTVVKGTISENSIIVGNPAKKVADVLEWTEKKEIENEYLFERKCFDSKW